MKKVFIILSVSLVAFTSCKKNTQDIQPQKPDSVNSAAPATSQAVNTTVTPQAVPLAAKFSFTAQDPLNIFEFQPISFSNLSTGAVSCVWEFGNTTKTQEDSPTMSYPMHGWYTVKLTVFDGKGNQQSTTQDVSILCLFANGIHPPAGAGG